METFKQLHQQNSSKLKAVPLGRLKCLTSAVKIAVIRIVTLALFICVLWFLYSLWHLGYLVLNRAGSIYVYMLISTVLRPSSGSTSGSAWLF
jgi:hypothetical protein